MNYFEEHDEPWKHNACFNCEACNSYFTEQVIHLKAMLNLKFHKER